jgi:hypothetical protein
MNELHSPHLFARRADMRLVGVVQLRVGGRLYAVPVQAMDFASTDADSETERGGFFVSGDTMGIVVVESSDERQVQEQIMEGCAQAVRHLSAKFLN